MAVNITAIYLLWGRGDALLIFLGDFWIRGKISNFVDDI